jgi:integrase
MPRPATGQVIEPTERAPSWALRFRAYGQRRFKTLGRPEDGWDRERAEAELRHVLADVERGIWTAQTNAQPQEPTEVPSFHEFASDWLAARRPELRPRTVADYEWALSLHLLPFFAPMRLDEIGIADVDRYKAAQAARGRLAAAQVNKTLKRLAQVLEVAVDYGYLPRNPAASKGGRRRLKEPKPRRSWVEPEQLLALLEAAPSGHRPVLATLAGGGLRVGEACALEWRDVNLATGTLIVRDAKTDAGTDRQVDLPLGLADELRTWKAQVRGSGGTIRFSFRAPATARWPGRLRATSGGVSRRRSGGRTRRSSEPASSPSASASPRTRSGEPTPRCEHRRVTIPPTSQSSWATRTQPSQSGSMRRPRSADSDSLAPTWRPLMLPFNGQGWAGRLTKGIAAVDWRA